MTETRTTLETAFETARDAWNAANRLDAGTASAAEKTAWRATYAAYMDAADALATDDT